MIIFICSFGPRLSRALNHHLSGSDLLVFFKQASCGLQVVFKRSLSGLKSVFKRSSGGLQAVFKESSRGLQAVFNSILGSIIRALHLELYHSEPKILCLV